MGLMNMIHGIAIYFSFTRAHNVVNAVAVVDNVIRGGYYVFLHIISLFDFIHRMRDTEYQSTLRTERNNVKK